MPLSFLLSGQVPGFMCRVLSGHQPVALLRSCSPSGQLAPHLGQGRLQLPQQLLLLLLNQLMTHSCNPLVHMGCLVRTLSMGHSDSRLHLTLLHHRLLCQCLSHGKTRGKQLARLTHTALLRGRINISSPTAIKATPKGLCLLLQCLLGQCQTGQRQMGRR